tara:strand:+ start:539 stop:796 length:258 start_codon:yes stop_codon:yes gene_type:complete
MSVKNTQRDRINSNCSPEELGRAIAGIDLASIPPEKRKQAITERLVEVMLATTDSTEERRKPNYQLALDTYGQLRRRRARSQIII